MGLNMIPLKAVEVYFIHRHIKQTSSLVDIAVDGKIFKLYDLENELFQANIVDRCFMQSACPRRNA